MSEWCFFFFSFFFIYIHDPPFMLVLSSVHIGWMPGGLSYNDFFLAMRLDATCEQVLKEAPQ